MGVLAQRVRPAVLIASVNSAWRAKDTKGVQHGKVLDSACVI